MGQGRQLGGDDDGLRSSACWASAGTLALTLPCDIPRGGVLFPSGLKTNLDVIVEVPLQMVEGMRFVLGMLGDCELGPVGS